MYQASLWHEKFGTQMAYKKKPDLIAISVVKILVCNLEHCATIGQGLPKSIDDIGLLCNKITNPATVNSNNP